MKTSIQYRNALDGSRGEAKKKVNCCSCGGKKTFTRYKNYDTGEYIDDTVGLCDRINRCGYHLTPKQWFADHPEKQQTNRPKYFESDRTKPAIHIPFQILKESLRDYEDNSFVQALLIFFPATKVEKAVAEYYLGTAQSLTGDQKSVVFWFIDRNKNVRAGQVKEFDQNCKTRSFQIGDEKMKAYWVHRQLKKNYKQKGSPMPQWLQDYLEQDKYLTCLFGEHLLAKYPNKPVGLVEAPKTAVIGSLMYPDCLWLATTSLSFLTKERCRVLTGRNVMLFPDCGIPNKNTGLTCLQVWEDRINEFKDLANFRFSTLLEDNATPEQKESGFDLADFILQEVAKPSLEITSDEIQSLLVITKTGDEFGKLVLAFVKLKDGRYYDILYTQDGELITSHPRIKSLADFFEKSFMPGKLDGENCLLNEVCNS